MTAARWWGSQPSRWRAGLTARFIGQVTYDDERLLEVPVVFPVGTPNESELEHLAPYLLAGGFNIIVYALTLEGSITQRLMQMVK